MHELKKLDEAKYFYNEMTKSQDNQEVFEYNISACLSAARSVLQYSLEEVKHNNHQKWYDKYIKSSTFIKFFKDKRDINIHSKPIETESIQEVTLVSEVSLHLSWEIRDKDGNIKSRSKSSHQNAKKKNEDKISHRIIYIFDDWNGSEDAVELVKKYLKELELFVKDGLTLKNISG